jgi:adenosine 3'-phospho 5'-phosphosulfate transporter B2
VLINRVVASCVALTAALVAGTSATTTHRTGTGTSIAPVAPLYAYAGVALSNFAATWCQYEALKYVSFPMQTLGKTGKMVPVMVIGALLHGKTYVARDYLLNGLITLGCTAFVLTGDVSSAAATAGRAPDTLTGVALMLGYLFVDGFTATLQERLFKGYTMSTWNQMLYVNLCSGAISIATLVATGGLWRAAGFAARHPALLRDALLLSLCAALGQVCIYSIIREFGALMFAGIMVMR